MNSAGPNARTFPPPRATPVAFAGLLVLAVVAVAAAADEAPRKPVSTFGADEGSERPDFADDAEALEPYLVSAPAYKPAMSLEEQERLRVHLNLSLNFGFKSWWKSPAVALTPARVPERTANVPYALSVLMDPQLHDATATAVPGAMLRVPDFALTARRDGVAIEGQARRLALRGIPVAVLRDGVPLGDPFTGDVSWSAIPHEGLARVELVSGGGASAWGNGTLGGALQFFTRPAMGRLVTTTKEKQTEDDPTEKRFEIHRTGRLVAGVGTLETVEAEFAFEEPTAGGILQTLGRGFSSDGAFLLARDQRGPIDQPASNRERFLEARWRQPVSRTLEFSASAAFSDQSSGDGTPYQHSDNQQRTLSATAAGSPSLQFAWNAVAHYRDSVSSRTVSRVDAVRQTETPWIDEQAVPAHAFGAAWTGAWWDADNNSRTILGADIRIVSGESRQDYAFVDNRFTRQRIAGGRQENVGVFVARHQHFSSKLRGSLGLRLDAWRESSGHQREIDLGTADLLGAIEYSNDSRFEAAPTAGLVWQLSSTSRLHLNGQSAFRRPTLAERYRATARVGILTDNNPDLRTEHNTSFELGVSQTLVRGVTLQAAVYTNHLTDHVAALPQTESARKLTNIDTVRLEGVRFGATVQPTKALTFEAAILWSRSRITRFDAATDYIGHELTRLPRRAAMAALRWQVPKGPALHLRVQSLGRPFVNLENTTRFDATIVADAGLEVALSERTQLFLTGENLTNTKVVTDISPRGERFLSSPRTWFGGVRFKW